MRLVKSHPILSSLYHFIIYYPIPSNITYFWNFGAMAGLCLVVQIVTGIALAMHYAPNVDLAFASVEHIMRDVNYGWLLRYVHANGASMFFIVVYIHMFRGLYYSSYMHPREALWCSGVIIFILMMATGFIGYVLPWGQMSFWGATVITNLFSAIPVIGEEIVYWLWGGFSVDNPTLNKFFSLHYLLPFAIAGMVIVHLIFLHEHGSNNPLGVESVVDQLPFTPYALFKDLYSIILFFMFFGFFVYFMPNTLGHPDNYIPANPMVTPPHIVPEWYFLPFYAILRSIPNKLGGVVAMFGAIVILLLVPFILTSEVRSAAFRPLYRLLFWIFFFNCLILGWIGGNEVKFPFYELGQASTVFYFAYFLILVPLCNRFEAYIWNPQLNKNYDRSKLLRIRDKAWILFKIFLRFLRPPRREEIREFWYSICRFLIRLYAGRPRALGFTGIHPKTYTNTILAVGSFYDKYFRLPWNKKYEKPIGPTPEFFFSIKTVKLDRDYTKIRKIPK